RSVHTTTRRHYARSHVQERQTAVDTITRILITAVLLSLCAFMRAAVGFGEALLAIPSLSMIMSISTASPVVTLAGLTMSLSLLVVNRESVDFPSARRLIVASFLGIPFGGVFLHIAPERVVKGVRGWGWWGTESTTSSHLGCPRCTTRNMPGRLV